MNEDCLGCEWYNKPYWSIISPCTNCSKRFKEKPIKVMKYSINIDKSDLYTKIEQLQQENQQLKRQIEIKDKWSQLIIDKGFDYDGFTKSEDLRLLIDDLVNYASNSIKADDKAIAYTNGLSNYNILEEEIGDNNE